MCVSIPTAKDSPTTGLRCTEYVKMKEASSITMKTIKYGCKFTISWLIKKVARIYFCAIYIFKPIRRIMKRMKLHLQAFVLFAPAIIGIICSTIIIVLLSLIYFIGLYRWSKTRNGRNFLRAYYREILRLENML